MLFAPPLEIIDLIENVYDKEGNFIEEKISDSATPEQKKSLRCTKRNVKNH